MDVSAQPPESPSAETSSLPEPEPGKPTRTSVTVAKNSFWLLIDNVAGLFASLYCSTLVARAMGPERMGDYNYVLYFAFILKMLTDVAIPQTFRKFAAEFMGRQEYSTLKTMVRVVLQLQIKLMIVGVGTGLLIVHFFFRPATQSLALLAVLTLVPGLLLSVPAGVLYGTENLRHNVLGSVTAMAVNLTGVTISVRMGWGLHAIVASMLASRVADCILRWLLYYQQTHHLPGKAQDQLDPALRTRLIRFAAMQLVPTLLYALLFDRMEILFLKGLSTSSQISFFSISFTLVQYSLIVPQTLAASASVTMMVKQGRNPAEAAQLAASATWLTILFGAPVLFGIASVADPLLRLLYGTQYVPAIPVLRTLAVFGIGLAASQSAQHLLVAAERQTFYVGWLLLCGAIDVAGCFFLVPRFGAVGAVYAKGISQSVAALGFLTFMVTQFRVRLPMDRVLRLVATSVAMLVAVDYVVRRVTPAMGLVLGIPLGVLIFVLLTRWLRSLDQGDRDRLRSLNRMVPARLRKVYLGLVSVIVPARPAAS